jgi:hypothetical protein
MVDNYRYATLLASLPHLKPPFVSQLTPLSRLKLENRLSMLDERDWATLQQIEDVLQRSRQPMERTDADIVAAAQELMQALKSSVLREIVSSRLDYRTIVVALRRRKRGESAPPPGQPWGYGRWVSHIMRYWNQPAFQLDILFPWVLEANRLLNENDAIGLERLLLKVAWDDLERFSQEHRFDFEAVVIYVLRWDLVARWTSYNREAATKRFAALVDTGLEEFAKVFG